MDVFAGGRVGRRMAGLGHAVARPGLVRPGVELALRAHAARGSCARRSSSGLGVPAAFNRAGEGPRAGRRELPWVSGEVVLDARAGSLPPWGNGLGVFARAGGVFGYPAAWPGYAAMAWWWPSWPAAIRGSHRVPCTVSDQIQRSSDAAQATRACAGVSLLSSSRLVGAACLAASTSQCRSTAQVARQVASRSAGRPRREILAWPRKLPDSLRAGDIPACLTTEDDDSYLSRSPVSAKIAARVTGDRPGIWQIRAVSMPSSASSAVMSASARARRARAYFRSARVPRARRSA